MTGTHRLKGTKYPHFLCVALGVFVSLCSLFSLSCCRRAAEMPVATEDVLLLEHVGYPQAICHDGNYYFTFQSLGGDSVELLCTNRLEDLSQARRRTVWSAARDTMTHFWSPEIYRVGDKWYLYFEGDDGNTDNHHLFVMECAERDPCRVELRHPPYPTADAVGRALPAVERMARAPPRDGDTMYIYRTHGESLDYQLRPRDDLPARP